MDKSYDTIVVGAGINGCGIALELSCRGQRVLVLDKGAIGGGTSSRSSRLIHGGLRYLETRRFGLVYEALHDRQELLEIYPDLVSLRPFYLPTYETSPRRTWKVWTGIKLYDLLAGRRNRVRSARVPKEVFQEQFPALRREGLESVFVYADGKTDDRELTRRVAVEAQQDGAEILEGAEVRGLRRGVDRITVETSQGEYHSPAVVNATGPWIDEIVERFGLPARYCIRKVSGVHLFLDGLLVPEPMFLQTREKRIFFIIPEPERNQTLIGTTERDETGSMDSIQVSEEDVAYLIGEANGYLTPQAFIRREDVREAVVGVRALVSKRADPTDLSREYELDLHRMGRTRLLHIFGGKLTTYLSLARRAARRLGVPEPRERVRRRLTRPSRGRHSEPGTGGPNAPRA
ncbi:MAG: glycerol-3-phosphate dehydrogenase/oxidase [Candidatus Latescibacteria bacterium]|jgi:glycerol-3-phosphate dehydrogenase|nr:glycerol-3-phosphate dehydrogenase/oxidase [Candidatus Latescibacterota bacterium]